LTPEFFWIVLLEISAQQVGTFLEPSIA
jgi:hypothetical protein